LVAGKKIARPRKYTAAELQRKGYVGEKSEGFPILALARACYIASVSGAAPGPRSQVKEWMNKVWR